VTTIADAGDGVVGEDGLTRALGGTLLRGRPDRRYPGHQSPQRAPSRASPPDSTGTGNDRIRDAGGKNRIDCGPGKHDIAITNHKSRVRNCERLVRR
jgi:hypothetical protein